MSTVDSFGNRLKTAMRLKNIRASELSKKTGIAPPIISDYLKGKYVAKQDKIYILAKMLDVNEAWLMGFDTTISRVPDAMRSDGNDTIINKINKLTEEQKEIVIKIIDNMKN